MNLQEELLKYKKLISLIPLTVFQGEEKIKHLNHTKKNKKKQNEKEATVSELRLKLQAKIKEIRQKSISKKEYKIKK